MGTIKLQQRERKVKGKVTRVTLYLRWWLPNDRKWRIEPLKLFLLPGAENRERNRETLALAQKILHQRQVQLDSGEFAMVPESKKREDFIRYCEKLAVETGDRNLKGAVKVLREYSPAAVPFRSFTFEGGKRWMEGFQKFLLKRCKRQNYAWMIETRIRAAIRKAIKEQLIARDFLIGVDHIPYQRPPHVFFTEPEICQLIKTPFPERPDVRRAMLFAVFSGLRWSDFSSLTWERIQGDFISFTQKKTGEATQVPLNRNAKEILFEGAGKVIDPKKRIFDLPGFKRTLQLLEIWRRRAGIQKKLTTHVGRHTYGHLLAREGFDPNAIRLALGQETLDAAMTYVHLEKKELKDKLDEKLPTFNFGAAK